jgi:hypothetical protein
MFPPKKMNHLTVKVPLTRKAHLRAKQFGQHQSNPKKTQQVYLNSLAVYAVNYYLNCLGIATSWEESHSSDPSFHTLSDTADLIVKNWGRLECRPVLPSSKVCIIPPEVWEVRDGYVAVQLNSELSEATLLGFFPKAQSEEMPLEQLQSLEMLLDWLHKPVQKEVSQKSIKSPTIQLNQWLEGLVETGWRTLEELLTPSPSLAFNFRRSSSLLSRKVSSKKIERGKLIQLERNDEQVALVVRLMPKTPQEIEVSVEVLPSHSPHLPADLRLMILDENERAVMQAEAGSSEGLEFQFSGEPGERFSVVVALGNFKMTEQFIL